MDPSPSPRQLGLIGIAGPTARRDDPDTSFAAGRLVDVDTQGTSFTGEVPSLVKRTPSTSEAGAPTSEAGGTPPPLTSSDLLKNPPPASWRSPSGMDDQDTRTTDDPQEPLDPFEEDVHSARAWPPGRMAQLQAQVAGAGE